MLRFCFLLCFVLLPAMPLQARSPERMHYLGENSGDEVDMQGKARQPFVIDRADWPRWGEAAIRWGLPKGARLQGFLMLGHNKQKPSHLLLRYTTAPVEVRYDPEKERMIFYRFDYTERGRPPRLREIERQKLEYYDLVEPSGGDPFGIGHPTLFLDFGAGGTFYGGYRTDILVLDDALYDFTPEGFGRVVLADDILADGRFAVVASDDRWGNYFLGCGQCGPLVPVVVVWRDNDWQEACREFIPYYEQRMVFYRERPGKDDGPVRLPRFLHWRTNLLLNLLQIGRVDEAQAVYDAMLEEGARISQQALAQEKDPNQLSILQEEASFLDNVRKDIGPLFEVVRSAPERACGLRAIGSQKRHPYGAIRRSRHFGGP